MVVTMNYYTETRPWGKFEILLDAPDTKVKRLTISPKQAPSYQYHNKRKERWIIVSGTGEVTLDMMKFSVNPGDVVYVDLKQPHRIRNVSDNEDLVFIEVQLGTYFGEDDIVRLNDEYGRTT